MIFISSFDMMVMSDTNAFSDQKRLRGQIEIFLYRAPKQNRDELVEVNNDLEIFSQNMVHMDLKYFVLPVGKM